MPIKKPAPKTLLEENIDVALAALKDHQPHTQEYAKIVSQLTALQAIRQQEKPEVVSKDTVIRVTGNLVGILMIVGYESRNIVTSKAIAFVGKFK